MIVWFLSAARQNPKTRGKDHPISQPDGWGISVGEGSHNFACLQDEESVKSTFPPARTDTLTCRLSYERWELTPPWGHLAKKAALSAFLPEPLGMENTRAPALGGTPRDTHSPLPLPWAEATLRGQPWSGMSCNGSLHTDTYRHPMFCFRLPNLLAYSVPTEHPKQLHPVKINSVALRILF